MEVNNCVSKEPHMCERMLASQRKQVTHILCRNPKFVRLANGLESIAGSYRTETNSPKLYLAYMSVFGRQEINE